MISFIILGTTTTCFVAALGCAFGYGRASSEWEARYKAMEDEYFNEFEAKQRRIDVLEVELARKTNSGMVIY